VRKRVEDRRKCAHSSTRDRPFLATGYGHNRSLVKELIRLRNQLWARDRNGSRSENGGNIFD
jgi:hypothetical protein